MDNSKLATILRELGNSSLIPIKDLIPDRNNSCLIKLADGLEFQMESDRHDKFLIVCCKLGNLSGGRYRENLFREALLENGTPPPHSGVFAFMPQSEMLVLFGRLHYEGLTGEKLVAYLEPFLAKALAWHSAITTGDIPAKGPLPSDAAGKMFGLRP